MKSRRGNWSFVDVQIYNKITREERQYWRELFSKILKIGIEFEMNLPEKTGSCHGTSVLCVCSKTSGRCWMECLNIEACKSTPNCGYCGVEDCGKRAKGKIPVRSCKDFKFQCLGLNCIDLVSKCHTCKERAISCDNCPEKYDANKDPDRIRSILIDKWRPTRNFSNYGKAGIWNVATDGSLGPGGGIEVITVGRRLNFKLFHKMVDHILTETEARGAYVNERCGLHMHVLNGYYEHGGNEMEMPIPTIVLANLLQIIRKYQPALVWMTSAGSSHNNLTRWEKFRLSLLPYSPLTDTMQGIQSGMAIESRNHGNDKYHFVNFQRSKFKVELSENGSSTDGVSIFHVEFRFPDANRNPLIIASFACMFYAMVMRAIDFSQYGILEAASSQEELATVTKSFEAICNGRGNWDSARISDTRNAKKYYDYYRETSKDLMDILKPILIDFGPAYDILEDLAERPVALRLIEGESFQEIEQSLSRYVVGDIESNVADEVMSAVDLSLYTECINVEDWINCVTEGIKVEHPSMESSEIHSSVTSFIMENIERESLAWNKRRGTVILK